VIPSWSLRLLIPSWALALVS